MLTNYLKVAFRAVRRYPVYALVGVGSLAIGFAACLVIYLYVQDEQSYERFHPDAERVYRLTRQWEESGFRPNMPAPAAAVIATENPENVLRQPTSIALSRSMTSKYFGDPVKSLRSD